MLLNPPKNIYFKQFPYSGNNLVLELYTVWLNPKSKTDSLFMLEITKSKEKETHFCSTHAKVRTVLTHSANPITQSPTPW